MLAAATPAAATELSRPLRVLKRTRPTRTTSIAAQGKEGEAGKEDRVS